MNKFKFILSAAFVFVFLTILTSKSSTTPSTPRDGALGACRLFIEREVSANFIQPEQFAERQQDGTWVTVLAYYTKNQYNATVKTTSICHLRLANDNWELLTLNRQGT